MYLCSDLFSSSWSNWVRLAFARAKRIRLYLSSWSVQPHTVKMTTNRSKNVYTSYFIVININIWSNFFVYVIKEEYNHHLIVNYNKYVLKRNTLINFIHPYRINIKIQHFFHHRWQIDSQCYETPCLAEMCDVVC